MTTTKNPFTDPILAELFRVVKTAMENRCLPENPNDLTGDSRLSEAAREYLKSVGVEPVLRQIGAALLAEVRPDHLPENRPHFLN